MSDLGDPAIQQLMPLLPHMEIAHHIPGRIRLKVLLSGLSAARKIDIQGVLREVPGVIDLRLNAAAKSVVIQYDQERIPYDFWQLLGQLKTQPELFSEIATRLQALLTN